MAWAWVISPSQTAISWCSVAAAPASSTSSTSAPRAFFTLALPSFSMPSMAGHGEPTISPAEGNERLLEVGDLLSGLGVTW